jgi:S-layer protein
MPVTSTIVTQYYTGIFRQAPSAAVSTAYQAMTNDAAALNSMLSAANVQVDPVVRLYQTAFNRLPDTAGMTAWVVPFSTGAITLERIATGFTQSTEFTTLYPTSMSNSQFVGALYWNILQRQGEDAGIKGWVDALNKGALTRAQVLLGFSESGEFTKNIEPAVNTFLTNIAQTPLANQGAASLYTGSLFDLGGAPVTTYNLTTAIETINAVGPNTVVNGILGGAAPTLQSFDVVKGTGTTTFNLLDQTAAAFPGIPASTSLSGFGIVNLSRNGAAAASNAVTITNSTFGSGVTGFNLVNAGDLTTAAGVDITLNSATAVSVVNTAATKYTTVAVTDTSTTAAQTGSTLKSVTITGSTGNATLTGNAIATVALNGAATGGTVTVTAAAGTRALTVNTAGTTNSGAVTDAEATSLILNQTSAATIGTVTVAKATAVTINTTGTATTAGAETIVAAKMTSLTLGGTRANTVTITQANNPLLATVAVTGTGGATLGDLLAFAALTLVDTSAATNTASATGAANLTVANSVTIGNATAFTGGAGDDQVTVGATTKAIALGDGKNKVTLNAGTTALGTGGSITAGSGTADTLVLANADAVTLSTSGAVQTAFKAAVTGFEVLELATAAGSTVNVAGAGAFTSLNITSAAVTQVLSGVTSGFTLNVTDGGAAFTSLTTNNIGGSADVLNIKLNGDLSGAARAFGVFTTPGVETINLAMADTNLTFAAQRATAEIVDAGLQSLVITGNNGLALTFAGTALTNFDASGLTKGSVSWTSGALVGNSVVKGSVSGGDVLNLSSAVASSTITATAGANTLSGSSSTANTITSGSGADTITGGTAADTINAGDGANVIYGDNRGTKEVQTVTITFAGGGANTITTNNIVTTFTAATNADTSATAAAAAINANASLKGIVSASAATNVVTLTFLVDGDQTAATFGAGATGNAGAVATTTAGTAGTAAADTITAGTGNDVIASAGGNNVITGGAGADTFYFLKPQSIVSGGTTSTINDFVVSSTATGDRLILGDQTAALGTLTTVQDFSSQATLAAAVNSAALGNAVNDGTTVFLWGGASYVYVETTGAGSTAANSDFIVKLAGTPAAAGSLVTGNFILGV